MKKYIVYFIFAVSTALFSCEKTVDNVDLPDVAPVLVAHSFLETGADSLKVFLTKSIPIFYTFENGFKDVEDATVIISDGSNQVSLQYSGEISWGNGFYSAAKGNLSMAVGTNYSLTITTPAGDLATASCIIQTDPAYNINFIKLDSTFYDYYSEYSYSFDFTALNTDPDNYYYIEAVGSYSEGGIFYKDQLYTNSGDFGLLKLKNGAIKSLSYAGYKAYEKIEISILKTDEAYYLYHKSAKSFEGDNPFSEPVIIYTNIQNGLGVFCGYSLKTEIFNF